MIETLNWRVAVDETSGEPRGAPEPVTTGVQVPLSDGGDAFAISRDGRTIFYSGLRQEADIWIVERPR